MAVKTRNKVVTTDMGSFVPFTSLRGRRTSELVTEFVDQVIELDGTPVLLGSILDDLIADGLKNPKNSLTSYAHKVHKRNVRFGMTPQGEAIRAEGDYVPKARGTNGAEADA